MQDRRIPPRHRTFKTGMIGFNESGGISCTVRNLAETGANLAVSSQVGIPDHFTLTIASAHLRRLCRVAWRRDDRIGVVFE